MNYLSHIFLADLTSTSRIGNFLGDFVKGNIESLNLPHDYAQGIYLHRRIDSFTDSHPIVQRSKYRISKDRRRFSGIIVDVVYDHFLMKHWNSYTEKNKKQFILSFYYELQKDFKHLPKSAQQIIDPLIRHNWLMQYNTLEGVSSTLNGISKRFKRQNTLSDSINELELIYHELDEDFNDFFDELIEFVLKEVRSSKMKLSTIF